MEEGRRFINAYNLVDNAIRARFNFSDNMSYGEVIRRASDKSGIVRKYEHDLISYGKLRNAIVHDSVEGELIANPTESVVCNFEKIAELLCRLPLAIDNVNERKVIVVYGNEKAKELSTLMRKKGYSNLPIVEGEKILGVITDRHIVFALADCFAENIDPREAFEKMDAKSLLSHYSGANIYAVLAKTATLDKVMDEFSDNAKVRVVMITESGELKGRIVGIFTRADVARITQLLDVFDRM